MFKKQMLLAKLVENGHTLRDLSEYIGINNATLSKKVNGRTEFTRSEIQKIRKYLDLTPEDVDRIFFAA